MMSGLVFVRFVQVAGEFSDGVDCNVFVGNDGVMPKVAGATIPGHGAEPMMTRPNELVQDMFTLLTVLVKLVI